jgi:phage-related minor tail protein
MATITDGKRVTRQDVEQAVRKALGEGEDTARSAMPQVVVVVGAVALGALALAYLAGRRRGRRRTARIEIRQG